MNPAATAKGLFRAWFASILFVGWSAFCAAIGAAIANIGLITVLHGMGINLADYL